MSLRFLERSTVRALAPLFLLAVIVFGCSSTPPAPRGETTETTSEALAKCGPCQTADCQTCGTEDGCHPPRTTCTCSTDSSLDGKACAVVNKCDLPGTCNEGVCVSRGPVTCTPPDECHVASCDATTGGCTSKPAPDGTPCGPLGQNTCSAGTCVVPCGLMTCASQHVYCGQTGDGCGHIINCGTCTAPETCGGGGVPSTCGAPHCTKQTCAQIGASCGVQADGCGGTMNCGSCPLGQTCGGAGVHNQCGSNPCKPKTCADYPPGTCGPQADGCGGATPNCRSCTSPETCGGGGTLDQCGYCGGFGYAPCSWGCNNGAIDDGKGHCVQCSNVNGHASITTKSSQLSSPNWNVEVDYDIGLPSASSFQAVVQIFDAESRATQSQLLQGPTGKAIFADPMWTAENSTVFATIAKLNDPACVLQTHSLFAPINWTDATPSSLCPLGKLPNFVNRGSGSRPGPVGLVPLLWGFTDKAFSDNLDVVYRQFDTSNYYAWLRREYGAPELKHSYPQTVPATATGSVKDQLDSFIRNNQVPNTGMNLVYIVHLAPGQVVSTSTLGTICVTGNTVAYNAMESDYDVFGGTNTFFYVVVPDPRTNCFGAPLGQDGLTTALTHEIAESVTDPDTSKPGWEDTACPNNGNATQIGDLCAPSLPVTPGLTAAIATPYFNPARGDNNLVVQKLWSNRMGACVTEDSTGVPFN